MSVYVETNFVLELALVQEQSENCQELISLCEAGRIMLILPAYCLVEPFETLMRRDKKRNDLKNQLDAELNQLARSLTYAHEVNALQDVATLLSRSGQEDAFRLDQTIDQILQFAEIIPLERNILALSRGYQTEFNLSPQDGIVYTSIEQHLRAAKSSSCFITKNSKDFGNPDVVETLEKQNCKVIFSFDQGYNYVSSCIA